MMPSPLSLAFKALRSKGYFARQNFFCCQSCGCSAVPEDKAGTYVFYHSQDARDLRQKGSCYLAWSGDPRVISEALQVQGITVEHDGSSGRRIKITL